MSAFHTAVQDYLEAIQSNQPREISTRAQQVIDLIDQADQEAATWGLMAMVPILADNTCPYHALTACLCEPMMRKGGDPWLVVGLLIERFSDALRVAAEFRHVLRERCAGAGVEVSDEITQRGEVWLTLAREQPWNAYVASTLDLFAMPSLPVAAHFPQARQFLRADPRTLDRAFLMARDVEGVSDLLRIVEENSTEPLVPQQETVEEALRQLDGALAMGPRAKQEVSAGLLGLYRALFGVSLETRNVGLRGLADLIAKADVGFLGEMGQLAGSLVETGGDPTIALDAIMTRLPEVLQSSGAFLEGCRRRGTGNEEITRLVESHGEEIARQMPVEASALRSASSLCLGAIAMLSRSRPLRKRYCGNEAMIEQARALSGVVGSANFLRKMLQVLDDETLIVVAPEDELGWRIRIHGIADNFQLHTLLVGSLIGPMEEGYIPGLVGVAREGDAEMPIPGRPLDRRAVEVARSLPCTMRDMTVWSRIQLWTWRALQADGSLSDNAVSSNDAFVWNEGVPADIPLFKGERIILMGSAPLARSWNGGRIFSGMSADLKIEERLDAETLRTLLHQIAIAPR